MAFRKYDTFRKVIIAFSLLIGILITGNIGYIFIEGYTFTEAFFMTIITIATVGFKEVRPLSNGGIWFTSFLIIFSFGIFAYAVSTFTQYVVDGVFHNYFKSSRVRRKIRRLKNHIIVCGYGRNGRQAVAELITHNAQVVVIENDTDALEEIIQIPDLLYIQGDATHDDVLDQCGVENAKALITTLPVDADNLFVVLSAKEINPDLTVISRASEDHSDSKLKRAGATNIIMPDKIGGQRMAKLVTQPDVVEFLEYIMLQSSENVTLEEISCYAMADKFEGKSIRELEKLNESGANIVGLKRADKSFVINPLPEILLSSRDKIFALGTSNQIESLRNILVHGNI
jgi:voltage-gated potassium channel